MSRWREVIKWFLLLHLYKASATIEIYTQVYPDNQAAQIDPQALQTNLASIGMVGSVRSIINSDAASTVPAATTALLPTVVVTQTSSNIDSPVLIIIIVSSFVIVCLLICCLCIGCQFSSFERKEKVLPCRVNTYTDRENPPVSQPFFYNDSNMGCSMRPSTAFFR